MPVPFFRPLGSAPPPPSPCANCTPVPGSTSSITSAAPNTVAFRLPSFNRDPEVAAACVPTIALGSRGGDRRGARLPPYSAEQCVALTEEDLTTLEPADDKTILLEHFLSPTEFDLTLLAGRSLYLAPADPAALLGAGLRPRRNVRPKVSLIG